MAQRGGVLSTVTSDEVFVTPKGSISSTTKTIQSVGSNDGGTAAATCTDGADMAEVAREGPSLDHVCIIIFIAKGIVDPKPGCTFFLSLCSYIYPLDVSLE